MSLFVCPLVLLVFAQDRPEPRLPWVVVGQVLPVSHDALYDPHILARSDGSLIATVTHVGHGGIVLGTHVYRSTDHGSSWSQLATVPTPCDAALFEAGGKLYLLGTHSYGGTATGRAEICRSVDGGETWPETTFLGSGDRWKTSDDEILRDHGRFWRLYERKEIPASEAPMHLSVASAPIESDLMNPESWTWSEELSQEGLGVRFCILAPGSGRGPILLGPQWEKTLEFVADLTSDGRGLQTRSAGNREAPTYRSIGWTRSLERDPSSDQAFVLKLTSSRGPNWQSSDIRLESSGDFTRWTDRSLLLRDDRKDGVEFGACARTYAGEDLLLIVCARVPGTPGVDTEDRRGWNVLFLRVPKFRERNPDTPPLWDRGR